MLRQPRLGVWQDKEKIVNEYPSIASSKGHGFQEFDAYIFDKLDGNNLRWQWARKSGWYKFGTRTRLFDAADPWLGRAIPIFMDKYSDPLAKIATDQRWDRVIVFTEFHGATSLGGFHMDNEPRTLTLFDVNPHKKGILGPKQFLDLFGGLDIPRFLGHIKWTRGFVERVFQGEVPGITHEGVVGKAGDGNKLIMRKAKQKIWIAAIKARYNTEEAERILNS